MAQRYLSDSHWTAVHSLLPGKEGDPGCRGRDNRLFLDAVLWVAQNRAPWRDLPTEYGKWYTVYTRFRRWEKRGVWPRVFEALAHENDCEFALEDGEILWRPGQTDHRDPHGAPAAAREAA